MESIPLGFVGKDEAAAVLHVTTKTIETYGKMLPDGDFIKIGRSPYYCLLSLRSIAAHMARQRVSVQSSARDGLANMVQKSCTPEHAITPIVYDTPTLLKRIVALEAELKEVRSLNDSHQDYLSKMPEFLRVVMDTVADCDNRVRRAEQAAISLSQAVIQPIEQKPAKPPMVFFTSLTAKANRLMGRA